MSVFCRSLLNSRGLKATERSTRFSSATHNHHIRILAMKSPFEILVATQSWFRLLSRRILGLRTGHKVTVGKNVRWPIFGLQRIIIGNNVGLMPQVSIWLMPFNNTSQIIIEDNVTIGEQCRIGAGELVKIGKGSYSMHRVTIADFGHIYGPKNKLGRFPPKPKPVLIGEGCSIGAGSLIKPGTVLGEYCVVEPNSVVSGKFQSFSVLCGNPAVVVRTLDELRSSISNS